MRTPAQDRPAVLLAAGDPDLREDVRRALTARYELCIVADCEEALAALRQGERPDVLLTETAMPSLDGPGLLRALRADPALADLPVILLADGADDEIAVESIDPGLVDYITKPFSPRELLARVASSVETVRLRAHCRRAEETARLAQERLRVALIASRTGTYRWHFATDMVEADAALNRLFGFPASEATRSIEEFLPCVHPDNRQQFRDALELCRHDAANFELEYRILLPDGTSRWVQDRGRTFRDAAGRPRYMTGACVDITERKHAEEKLQAALAESARVTRQTAMGELAASIAHEINQPLGAIVSNGDALIRWLAADPPELAEARNTAKLIAGNAHRASEVIKRIRALLAKEAPRHDALDINDAIREVLLLTRSVRDKGNVSLRIELSPDLPAVLGDRVQLQQAILNLVSNALDAMGDVSDRPQVISIGSRRGGPDHRYVLVSVGDTGTGISPEAAGRIFDPFFTTKATGMGMGLSVCRSIVEAHEGRLRAFPATPHGTIFEIALPTAKSGPP
jgi:PAS domain S-box-containing protein